MRKLVLLCASAFVTAAAAGPALAQTPPAGAPSQGQTAWPLMGSSPATVNNNNNMQPTMGPGVFANPTPGTIVVHINGRVNAGFASFWSNADQRVAAVPAPGTGTGVVKLAPYNLYSYARLYFGADAMATNGLRYGAGIELRQNFTGQQSNAGSSGASGYTSTQTIFVRRAFTYVAGDSWGVLRAGVGDGVIGIFDNGVTTLQYLPTGNLQNGSDLASLAPGNAAVPFFFLSGDGNEYGNTKLVYLSPQFAGGFDLGLQYAPNTSNGFGLSTGNPFNTAITGAGVGTGLSFSVANTGCPTLSSGPGSLDGSRILNQTVVGLRYQGSVSGVGLLAYAAYGVSGHANYTGPTTAAVLGNTAVPNSQYTGKFDGLNFGNGGIALTYAGFTVGANVIGGRINGTLGLVPQNGVSEIAFLVGAKYAIGPFTVGVSAERGDYQGNMNLTGISQRRARALDVGASYAVAPGYLVYAEYQYQDIQQSMFNFITSSVGSSANNSIRSQGFVVGNIVNF